MSVSPQKPAGQDIDPEATDELPALEFAASSDGGTDTFVALAVPASIPDLADSLRDVESRLQRKTERLHELEEQLAIAEAAQKQLRDDLDSERRTAAAQLEQERSAAASLLEATRKSAAEIQERSREESLALLERERIAAAHTAAEADRMLAAEKQSLAETRSTLEAMTSNLATTQARLADHERQVAELRRSTTEQTAQLRHQGRDLDELRRRAERQHEALSHSLGFDGVLEGLLAERDAALADIEARHAADIAARDERTASLLRESAEREARTKSESELAMAAQGQARADREAQLVAEHAKLTAALEQELEQLRKQTSARVSELEDSLRQRTDELVLLRQQLENSERNGIKLAVETQTQRATIGQQQEELTALRATDEAARAGIEIFEQQRQRITDLEGELAALKERSKQLEEEGHAAREQIERLESDARASSSLLGNLQQNMARLGREDSGARPALKLVSADPLPERYLVSDEDGTQTAHPLGRRTSIGRTPDNDIQIVASFISRNHAVILGSPQHCIIEDLNSTNGVLVNGRRVTRDALRDGDSVTIGRSRFRYRQNS